VLAGPTKVDRIFLAKHRHVQFNRNLFPFRVYEASFRPPFHIGDWINMIRAVKERKHNDFWIVPFKRIEKIVIIIANIRRDSEPCLKFLHDARDAV
jgi:hypothetical protein